jgi:hypothetical protein
MKLMCLSLGILAPSLALADNLPLTLTPSSAIVLKGLALDFRAQIGNAGHDITAQIQTWTSSNLAVASINSNGQMTAVGIGTTTITGSLGALNATAQVTVDAVTAAPFLVQPVDTKVNAVIAPTVKVAVQDNLGRFLSGMTVTIAIAPNPVTPGVLSGTLTRVTDASGSALFADLKLNYQGVYLLQAAVATPTGAFISTSNSFVELPVNPCLASLDVFSWSAHAQTLGCADSDGDGLFDAWEAAGGIDFDGDGVVAPWEKVLTNADPTFPDGTFNPYPSADPNVKDIFVKYDWMELPDQLSGGQPIACTVNLPPLSGGADNFQFVYPYHSDQCGFDQLCLTGRCKGHSDAPDPFALKMVIDSFAAHNIRLHLIRGHAVPHANVTSLGTPLPDCILETSTFNFSGSHAADFYADIKQSNFNAQYNGQSFSYGQLIPFAHYAVFAHRSTCDSAIDCAQATCVSPSGRARFNETGRSEAPGNDIIISMGQFQDSNLPARTLTQGGTFMHELGHNLGLEHGGPLFIGGVAQGDQVKLNFKPNYLSVMNYSHQSRGIGTADPNCAANDYVCKTTAVKVRLDYSSFVPGFTPTTLDENQGTEAAGINIGNSDIGYTTTCQGAPKPIPGTGPVDFDCDGNTTGTWCASGCTHPFLELNNNDGKTPNGSPGSGDVLMPFEDWPNLIFNFQGFTTFNNGAPLDPFPGATVALEAPQTHPIKRSWMSRLWRSLLRR